MYAIIHTKNNIFILTHLIRERKSLISLPLIVFAFSHKIS